MVCLETKRNNLASRRPRNPTALSVVEVQWSEDLSKVIMASDDV